LANTPVSAVMTSQVTCVDGELDLEEVDRIFRAAGIHGAPVVEDRGVLLGVVSQSDLVQGDSQPGDRVGVLVEDVMTTEVVKLPESASLADAARYFADKKVHRIPIVGSDDVVVGVLSLSDLIRWIVA
jgi:IMP dehydrogenase